MLCHRPVEEPYPAGPAVAFGETELILSSQTAVKGEEDTGGPSIPIVAYLTKASALYAQASYSYTWNSVDVFDSSGQNVLSRNTTGQKTLFLLAYGLIPNCVACDS
jgi:hypothetical protein